MRKMGWMIVALALAGCGTGTTSVTGSDIVGTSGVGTSGAGTRAAFSSPTGLDVVPLSIVSGGRTHRFQVEVARTEAQQSRGLMYRERLAPDRGMIFPFSAPRAASFWMRNTPSSLDLIFIGTDGRIESIGADAVPLSEAHIDSQGVVASVLEIASGRAAELGLKAGDRVEWGG